jgi:hypothetical protein
VLEYLAGQLGIRRPEVVRDYMMREMTRFEHRWEIQTADGWQEFAQVTEDLTRWVDRPLHIHRVIYGDPATSSREEARS